MGKQKYFIITVDTEGDNLWRYKDGEPIGTRNAEYLPRFQALCERYGFKPVYLTNYEMAMSDVFVREAKEWLSKGTCEIGVHLHAWNNPPIYELKGTYCNSPYLIEYPEDVMREKFKVIYDLLIERFGIQPFSHRAGRWAMDRRYFAILKEFGIKVDCSYTPGIDWSNSTGITMGGSNYSNEPKTCQIINGVLEVPATIRTFRNCLNGNWKHRLRSLIKGETVWFRPAMSSAAVMKKIIDIVTNEKDIDFVEFMLHSSEIMPDGSPYFVTEADIDKEFKTIESVFVYACKKGYIGCTLQDYCKIKKYE